MYSVSAGFLSNIKSNSRTVNARVTIGATVIPVESIVKFSIEESFGSNKMPTIGGATSSVLNLEILNTSIAGKIVINTPIIPEVSVLVGASYEWIPLGTFYADSTDIVIGKVTTTFVCLDKMDLLDGYIYSSTLTFPTTVNQVLTDISANYPVIFASGIANLTDVINVKPEGTVRQVLSKIAFRLGTNVLFNRVGKCTFKFLSYSGFGFDSENYFEYKLLSGSTNRISQLTLLQSNDDKNPVIVGDTSGLNLQITSTVINNQTNLQTIFNRVYPLNFYSYNMTVQGMPHLEVGDTYDFTDVNNNLYRFAVVYHKLEFDGGLKSTFEVANPENKVDSVAVNQSTGTIGESILQVSRTLTQAIATSTNLITGNMGGHVRLKLDNAGQPEEILILIDSEDINTANKLWRWNAGGLGYSSTGYNGSYGLAMTSDGSIVATMITSGILNADIIQAGRIQSPDGLSYWDLDTGEIVLNVTSLKINAVDVATTDDIANIQIGGRNYYVMAHSTSDVALAWATGIETAEVGSLSTDFAACIPTEQFVCNYVNQQTLYYNINKEYIGGTSSPIGIIPTTGTGLPQQPTVVPTDVIPAYFKISFRNNFLGGLPKEEYEIMLEKGNVSTDWQPSPEDTDIAIGTKADNQSVNDLGDIVDGIAGQIAGKADNGELQNLLDAYNQRVTEENTRAAEVSDSLTDLNARTVTVETTLGDKVAKWTFIENSVVVGEEGVFIGDTTANMGILISVDPVTKLGRISFMDKGTEVAYVSNKVMQISHGIFVESAVIGKHKIETIDGTDISVFTYVG